MIASRRRLRAPNRETQRREIADLNHQRGHAAVTSLGVHLAALYERHLTGPDGVSHPVAALDPARSLHRREQLTEFGQVRPNYAAALEIDQKDMPLGSPATTCTEATGASPRARGPQHPGKR